MCNHSPMYHAIINNACPGSLDYHPITLAEMEAANRAAEARNEAQQRRTLASYLAARIPSWMREQAPPQRTEGPAPYYGGHWPDSEEMDIVSPYPSEFSSLTDD